MYICVYIYIEREMYTYTYMFTVVYCILSYDVRYHIVVYCCRSVRQRSHLRSTPKLQPGNIILI